MYPSMAETFYTLLIESTLVPGERETFSFAKECVAIGRALANDVMLSNTMRLVSRQHAEIRRQANAYWLMDLGSKNATWLNGYRLEVKRPYVLNHGDHFRVGDYRIEFILSA